LIGISEQAGGATITIPATNQFASGGVDPEAKLRPLLVNIASALNKTTGSIVVIGHADATPSSNPRFPSNQALSEARAASVGKVMMSGLSDPKRLKSEGASDSQPLAPSDTVENRAKNRRVVIVLKPAS
jgi:type VI secretion system protein ImpK